jgi:tyrosine-protein kinase
LRASGDAHGATSLRDYLNVARRRKWIILQAVLLVPIAAVVYSLQQTPVYSASAQVLLSRQNLATSLTGIQDPSQITPDSVIVQTQSELARIPEIARRSIVALNLHTMTPGEFLANSSVSSSLNTDLLGFSFKSTDSKLAPRAANEYAHQYTLYRRQLDTASLESARQEVSQRVSQLVAQGDQNSSLYATLVEREQQLRTMEALQTSNANVVKTADSSVKVSPTPFKDGVLGLMIGIFLGIGLALLREALDTGVRSAEEVSDRLEVPLLGRIPEPPKRLRQDDRLVMLDEPAGLAAEAFRVLRTNLEFAALGHDVRTVMITSAVAQEGKSTTIANLAIALARGGQDVVLVDLDLRRPYLERFFDLGDRPGVTQVVLGRSTLEDAFYDVTIAQARPSARLRPQFDLSHENGDGAAAIRGRLRVLGAGPIPPDPGEFVASAALSGVLEELRESADIVLVDSPPLLQVGDAMVLSAKVDAIILATRMEKVRRPMLAEVRRVLETAPARKLGFVVTGAEAEEGYGLGYGYGYGYGYVYGGERATEPESAGRRS